MLTLKVSTNLGVLYKIVKKFNKITAASDYIEHNHKKLSRQRWVVEESATGQLLLVCPLFEDTAREIERSGTSVSDDAYLKKYLVQRLYEVTHI